MLMSSITKASESTCFESIRVENASLSLFYLGKSERNENFRSLLPISCYDNGYKRIFLNVAIPLVPRGILERCVHVLKEI